MVMMTPTIEPRRMTVVPAPDAQELATHLDRIQKLTDQLAKVRDDAVEQLELAARIHREIQAARAALKPPTE